MLPPIHRSENPTPTAGQEGADASSLGLLLSFSSFASKDGLVDLGLGSVTEVGEGLVAKPKEMFASSAVGIGKEVAEQRKGIAWFGARDTEAA